MIRGAEPISDYFTDVAKGLVYKTQDYSAFGINDDIDTASIPEDIWSYGGIFVPPTTFRIHNIVSTSANDTSAETGARIVHVYGVTSSGLENETIIMNGLTPVSTTKEYIDIYIFHIDTAGSSNTNAGQITATAQTDGTITASINVNGYNTSRKAIRYIPTGYTGYLYDFDGGMQQATASSSADVYLLTKFDGEVWLSRRFHGLSNSGNSHEKDDFKVPIVLPAGSWVKIQCTSVTNNNTKVQGGFNMILVQD